MFYQDRIKQHFFGTENFDPMPQNLVTDSGPGQKGCTWDPKKAAAPPVWWIYHSKKYFKMHFYEKKVFKKLTKD